MDSLHAVIVLIMSPEGIPLVRDPKKPLPHFWKLPGGRSEHNETPGVCAVREIWEELGLAIDIDKLTVIAQQDRGSHSLIFFRITLSSLETLKSTGNEGEEIRVFENIEAVLALPDLFPNHREILKNAPL